jgi:hypothetical protein
MSVGFFKETVMNNVKRLAVLLALSVLWLSGCDTIRDLNTSEEGGGGGTETLEDYGPGLYVSAAGHDENATGTRDDPFQTVTAALAKVKELVINEAWDPTVDKIVILDTVPVAATIPIGDGYPPLVLSGAGTLQFTGASGYLLALSGNAELTLAGTLTLQGNEGSGGVKMTGSSAFTMNGGKITGNTNGGVYVDGTSHFTMSKGEITENSAPNGGGVYVNGASAAFEMKGGKISDNHAYGTSSSESGGGGVYGNGGTFTMGTGAEISDNTATMDGGGVYMYSTNFIMNGGIIKHNSATGDGGGVKIGAYNSGFFMHNGEISYNEAHNGGGVSALIELAMSGGKIHHNEATNNGGGVYGHLTLSGTGEISNNTAVNGGGVHTGEYSAVSIEGGQILTNNATTGDGGGVHVDAMHGRFNLSAGTISGNRAPSGKGGGIYVGCEWEFPTLTGGTITGNTAPQGSAISYNPDSGITISEGIADQSDIDSWSLD